jgi:hypothetical protein
MSNPLAMAESGYKFEEGRGTGDMFREEGFRERASRFRYLFVVPVVLAVASI